MITKLHGQIKNKIKKIIRTVDPEAKEHCLPTSQESTSQRLTALKRLKVSLFSSDL